MCSSDLQSELVVIGQAMDKAAVDAALREALVTDEELARGPDAWAADLDDPFAAAWDAAEAAEAEDDHDHDSGAAAAPE